MDTLLKINQLLSSGNRTVTYVAKELKVNRSTLYSWGKATYPKVDQLIKLASIYEVPISYFFDEAPATSHQSIVGSGNVAAINSQVAKDPDNIKDKEVEHLKMICEEKDKIIAEKERLIQLLMKK